MNSCLDKLTIIVPTYNRNFFLSRCCNYLSTIPVKKIIIADGSDKERQIIHSEYVEMLGNPRIEYYGYPDILGSYRLLDSLKKAQTPYVVFCSDKDFPIVKGLNESVRFLDKNPDYSIVDGHYYKAHMDNSQIQYFELYWGYHMPFQSDSALQRVFNHYSNYEAIFYAVHRTQNIKKAMEAYILTFKNHYESHFFETLNSSLQFIYGKYQRLNTLYWIRGYGPSGGAGLPSPEDFARTGELAYLYSLYEDKITKEIMEIEMNYSEEYIRKVLKSGFYNHFSKVNGTRCNINPYTLVYEPELTKAYAFRDLLLSVPNRIMKNYWRLIKKQEITHNSTDIGSDMRKEKQLNEITQWLLAFPEFYEKDLMIPHDIVNLRIQ